MFLVIHSDSLSDNKEEATDMILNYLMIFIFKFDNLRNLYIKILKIHALS